VKFIWRHPAPPRVPSRLKTRGDFTLKGALPCVVLGTATVTDGVGQARQLVLKLVEDLHQLVGLAGQPGYSSVTVQSVG